MLHKCHFCRDKHEGIAAASILLSRQTRVCLDKYLVAAPATDATPGLRGENRGQDRSGPSAQRADLNFCVRGVVRRGVWQRKRLSPGLEPLALPISRSKQHGPKPFHRDKRCPDSSNACHHGHRYSCGGWWRWWWLRLLVCLFFCLLAFVVVFVCVCVLRGGGGGGEGCRNV